VAWISLWIAGLIGTQFVLEVQKDCSLEPNSFLNISNSWPYWVALMYWSTYFFQNVNVYPVTVNLAGWYFKEEGYKEFWKSGLVWALGPHSGGVAIASALMGFFEYLLDRVSTPWKMVLACLNPFDWFFLVLAIVLKAVAMTYTTFGLIASAYSGMGFLQGAPKTFELLKKWLGEVVICDFLGKNVMSWASYTIALSVCLGAWGWADSVQDIRTIEELDGALLVFIMACLAWFIGHPFFTMTLIAVFGRMITNKEVVSIVAALFIGCISYFILDMVMQVVTLSMNVTFFCYALEKELAHQPQERFNQLYGSIEKTFATGTVAKGDNVVVGTAVAPTNTE